MTSAFEPLRPRAQFLRWTGLLLLAASGVGGLSIAAAEPSQAATKGRWCSTADLTDSNWYGYIREQMQYCVSEDQSNVYWMAVPLVYGDATTRGRALAVSFHPEQAKSQTLCTPETTHARASCQVTLLGASWTQRAGAEVSVLGSGGGTTRDVQWNAFAQIQVLRTGEVFCRTSLNTEFRPCRAGSWWHVTAS